MGKMSFTPAPAPVPNIERTLVPCYYGLTQLWDHVPPRLTLAQTISDSVLVVLGIVGIAAFSTLKTWAIWGHRLIPTLAVLFASAVVPVINLYSTFPQSSLLHNGEDCSGYIARCSAIASDLLVLALTWVKTIDVWRDSKKIKGFKPTLSTILIRCGTVYFGLLLVVNVAVLALGRLKTDKDDGGYAFFSIGNALTANLLARFMLELRSVHDQEPGEPLAMSSIKFDIPSLDGNQGTPVGTEDSSRVSGPGDVVADESGQQGKETAVPLDAGLGSEVEEAPRET
ncbi:hypothetical protein EIP91_009236 [Steccherinum ochraceum]|uniref:Uncharacterized protein n=1 Tax=Steccherinum ochraceum TaxID=92696 RepID=A0A4R0R1X0_9APHY|nr:hypothetical protein EIP91_009236 [Steccherinum ochraceum]